jgi:phage minor structural protein, N-terminal domain protein
MIIYFADKKLNILGMASTKLSKGFKITDDSKVQAVDTGIATLGFKIVYTSENKALLEQMTMTGNQLLCSRDGKDEVYTIIDTVEDSKNQDIEVYAEDAGLDLLNDIAEPFTSAEAKPISWYIEKWTKDSGFEIGINEISDRSRKLSWDGEATVTERLASLSKQFDAEVSYSFDIKGLTVAHKYINIYKRRGKDVKEELRLNRDIDRIVVKKSISNLATALIVKGGTPEGQNEPITLKGFVYDDGDFYVDADGRLCSRTALAKWGRISEITSEDGLKKTQTFKHITKTYSYDTVVQKTLCNHAIGKLKKIRDIEENYEIDINKLPENIAIGDRINIIDEAGKLYLSARLLKLEESIDDGMQKATLGEYLIQDSGIYQSIVDLANELKALPRPKPLYTWIAYADDNHGNGISSSADGKAYLGISNGQASETVDLSKPELFTWNKVKGEDGKDGKSVYTWIAYASDDKGSNFAHTYSSIHTWTGIALGKDVETPSSDYTDYQWHPIVDETLRQDIDSISTMLGTSVEEAQKTATDYIASSPKGLMVADLKDGHQEPETATGSNVLITSEAVHIRNGQSVNASFGNSVVIRSEESELTLNKSLDIGYINTSAEGTIRASLSPRGLSMTSAVATINLGPSFVIGPKGGVNAGMYYSGKSLVFDREGLSSSHVIYVPELKIGNVSLKANGNQLYTDELFKAKGIAGSFMQANSTQNITLMKNGVITPFQLNNALFSSGDVFSLINGAIKVSEGGLYEISAGVYFENDVAASPFNGVYVKSNGNEIASTVITTRAGGGIGLASKVVSLTAGAEVTLNARHIGGANVTAEGNNPATYLYIKYLCRAEG